MYEKVSSQHLSQGRPRLSRELRREQILKAAEPLFAATGLRSTTTAGLARAAGVSEAILFRHFGDKEQLFKEVVSNNTRQRLTALENRFSSIPDVPPLECIDRMAQGTILACAAGEGNASVMVWALMETPEFAADSYRGEIGATEAMWDSEILKRFGGTPIRARLAVHLVPYVVHACMAFGFWLAALHHKPGTAQAHARRYAEGVVDAARMVLSPGPAPLAAAGGHATAKDGVYRAN